MIDDILTLEEETMAERWYVATMDNGREVFPSKRAAVDWCTATCDDGRKRPEVRRCSPGFYEYRDPPGNLSDHRTTFYIFTRGAGLRQHFFSQIAEIEESEKQTMEPKSDEQCIRESMIHVLFDYGVRTTGADEHPIPALWEVIQPILLRQKAELERQAAAWERLLIDIGARIDERDAGEIQSLANAARLAAG